MRFGAAVVAASAAALVFLFVVLDPHDGREAAFAAAFLCLTAAACAGPFLFVRDRADPRWRPKNYGWDKNPGFEETAKTRPEAPYWGLYYYYMTAAKALKLLGKERLGEHDWRKDMIAALVKRQSEDGSWINNQAARWNEDRRILVTSYALLALQEAMEK